MEVPEEFLKQLVEACKATMSLDQNLRNQATAFLKQSEKRPMFSLALLRILSAQHVELPVRLSAAIYFKNLLMRCWAPDNEDDECLGDTDREAVKKHLVQLMLSSPKPVQAQLSQALAIVSKEDFPAKWQSLLPELVQQLASPDARLVGGVLETAHSIFHRYRVESKSQRLWEEIAYVLGLIQEPLLECFHSLHARLGTAKDNKEELVHVVKALTSTTQIFFDLNAQDIPEFFEDHMKEWMEPFKLYLSYQNTLLDPSDDETPGLLDCLKTEVCDAITLYANKYEEQFKEYVPVFVGEAWNLLSSLDAKTRYDTLVTTAIKFLTSVVRKAWNKELFSNEGALKTICEKIIVPQIQLRESDVELFSMDGLEYIRRDVEGSDIDTRRRITMDFVQGLCAHFEGQITGMLLQYVQYLLGEYAKNPQGQWILKDAAMYVVLALTVKGSTKTSGATKTNANIDIIDFFKGQVLPELQAPDASALPVLKADCLKFVSTFRSQLPNEALPVLVPIVARFLACEDFVLHTYAAHALERLLSVKDTTTGALKFGRAQLRPGMENLLVSLFGVLDKEESRENEYAMKSIMRVCAVAEEDVAPLAPIIIGKITTILSYVSQNPKNPSFNHYLFETLSCLIRFVCKVNPAATDAFEQALFPPFQTMLGMETCAEFGPYCFQILAQLLELRSTTSDPYKSIFPACLSPALWDSVGNIPALVRLLQAYLRKPEGPEVLGEGRLTGVLGIFQKLNASKMNDHHGFNLLGTVFECIPMATLSPYVAEVFKMVFARIQTRKTAKYTEYFTVFMSRFCLKHGPEVMVSAMDTIQPQIFAMVLNKIWLPNMQGVSRETDRRIVSVALTNLLCKAPLMLQPPYASLWPVTLQAVINLFEMPTASGPAGDEDVLEQSAQGFSASFSKLVFAPEAESNPIKDITSTRQYLATSVSTCVQQNPGQFRQLLDLVPSQHQTAMMGFLNAPPASPVKAR